MTTGRIVTVEDHTVMHGLGAAVSQVVAAEGGARVAQIGIQDQFGQSATYEELLEMNDITVEGILEAAKSLLD